MRPLEPVRRHWIMRLSLSAFLFAGLSYVVQVVFNCAGVWLAGSDIALDAIIFDPFDWQDIAGLEVVFAILVLEWILVGWRQCSVRRLLFSPSESAQTDWSFLLLTVTGLYSALISIGGVGILAVVSQDRISPLGFGAFAKWPVWAALPALYLFRSFYSYWIHRAQHSRWLWSLHKVHHAAREFTVLNYLRAHPIELAWQTLGHTFALAAVGFPVDTIVLFEVLANAQQFLNHSNTQILAPLERLGIVTAAGHRVHHGVDEKFHNCNFGELLNIWDRVFGTYCRPPRDVASLPIGVPENHVRFNGQATLQVLWLQASEWVLTTIRHLASTPANRSS